MKILICISLLIFYVSLKGALSDTVCQARGSDAIVCVCNDTYCDTVTREPPIIGAYNTYTTSESGLRFSKTGGTLNPYNNLTQCGTTLVIEPRVRHQMIEGFGGAVTDAAGIHWKSLSQNLQNHLIESYFSRNGLEYNMIRVPIGGSDFSTHPYAYNEFPENDATLSNFTLAKEDYQYKIPLIKSAMSATKRQIHIVATTWSPPPWMKTNNRYSGISRLKPEYFQTYADYHLKFIQKYADEGIPVWAITTTNEPLSGMLGLDSFNTLGWTQDQMAKWIINNLGPTIRNSTHKNTKILAVDDQRISIPYWFNYMVAKNPKTLDYIDGIAVHYYTDFITPAYILTEVSKAFPDKFILATEACEGSFPWQKNKVELGSWTRAANYINDIITDLNHNVVGWIDWNLCLDVNGGPNWAKNFVDSPIIVFPENGEFVKQPMFYAIGHFSKFIPRGSVRIKVHERKRIFSKSIENVAFLTPHGTIVAVLYNRGNRASVKIKIRTKEIVLELLAKSISTVEFPFKI